MIIIYLKHIFPAIIFVMALFDAVIISTGSPVENDAQLMMFLRAQFDGLQSKLDQLAIQNSNLETKVAQLTTENQVQRDQFNILKADYEAKVGTLMAQSAKQEEYIRRLLKNQNSDNNIRSTSNQYEKDNLKIVAGEIKSHARADSSPKLPPSSCRQLSTIGHYLDGIYLVANPDTNKIEAVYCDFASSTLTEILYGNVDVKIKSVHFFVQRSSDFTLTNVVIPFDVEQLNEGGAMNLATGVFTVPVGGIYHFEFTGMKDVNAADIFIYLQVNGVNIGVSYATGGLPNYLSLNGISASLRLNVGDQVRLYKGGGILNDNAHFTHFTGWLVEEDLVLG